MKIFKILLIFTFVFIFVACEDKKEKNVLIKKEIPTTSDRWYSEDMLEKGKTIYANNCASCHGKNGEGVILPWNEKMDNDLYPPPPLNDDAHAWHHPLKALRFTIREGGKPVGGVMPPFKDKLSSEDIDNVIAHFQSFWTDPYYKEWLRRNGLNK